LCEREEVNQYTRDHCDFLRKLLAEHQLQGETVRELNFADDTDLHSWLRGFMASSNVVFGIFMRPKREINCVQDGSFS